MYTVNLKFNDVSNLVDEHSSRYRSSKQLFCEKHGWLWKEPFGFFVLSSRVLLANTHQQTSQASSVIAAATWILPGMWQTRLWSFRTVGGACPSRASTGSQCSVCGSPGCSGPRSSLDGRRRHGGTPLHWGAGCFGKMPNRQRWCGCCSIVTRVCRATYRQQLAPFVTGNIIPNKGLLAQHIRVGHYIIGARDRGTTAGWWAARSGQFGRPPLAAYIGRSLVRRPRTPKVRCGISLCGISDGKSSSRLCLSRSADRWHIESSELHGVSSGVLSADIADTDEIRPVHERVLRHVKMPGNVVHGGVRRPREEHPRQLSQGQVALEKRTLQHACSMLALTASPTKSVLGSPLHNQAAQHLTLRARVAVV